MCATCSVYHILDIRRSKARYCVLHHLQQTILTSRIVHALQYLLFFDKMKIVIKLNLFYYFQSKTHCLKSMLNMILVHRVDLSKLKTFFSMLTFVTKYK